MYRVRVERVGGWDSIHRSQRLRKYDASGGRLGNGDGALRRGFRASLLTLFDVGKPALFAKLARALRQSEQWVTVHTLA